MQDNSIEMTENLSSNTTAHSATTALGWVICILGALFYCYEYLLRIAPSTMVTELMQSFNLHAETFGAMVSLYYLAYTPMQAIVGVVHDLYGPRRVLTFAVVVCVIGSLLFSMTHSTFVASIARFLVGFGSAFAFVGALKLASVWLPLNRFALFAGSITGLGMVGGMFGNIGLSVFVEHVGWRQTLVIGTLAGVVLIPLIWMVIKDQPSGNTVRARNNGKNKYKETWVNLVEIVKSPQMWIGGIIACVLYLSLSVFAELWGNEFVSSVYGFPKVEAATINSMVFLGWLVGSPLTGWISDRIQKRRLPLTLGCILAGICSLVMLYWPHLSREACYVLLFLFGFFCSAQVICFAVGRENARTQFAGTAVAFINLLVMLGGMVFQPLVGKFLDMTWSGAVLANGVRDYTAHDFKMAFILLPISLAIGALLTFVLRETHATEVVQNDSGR